MCDDFVEVTVSFVQASYDFVENQMTGTVEVMISRDIAQDLVINVNGGTI